MSEMGLLRAHSFNSANKGACRYKNQNVRQGMDHRTPISSREAKILWLLAHQSLWEGFSPDNDQNWRHLIKLMKFDGLIARSTYPLDVNVPSLIADADRR